MQKHRHRFWLFSALLVAGFTALCCALHATGRASADRTGDYEHVWTQQERMEWVAWKLGFREDPPFDPLIDLIANTIDTGSWRWKADTQLSLQVTSRQSVDEGPITSE